MHCRDFRRSYTDYRDGFDPVLAAEMDDHLESCQACAAFDRAIRQGIHSLQSGQLEPSRDFARRLQQRLASEEPVPEPHPPRVSALGATAAAILFALMVALTVRELAVLPPPAAAESPMVVTEPRIVPGIPFVVFEPIQPPGPPPARR
jgi:anti-sigma factor RsiW